MSPGDNDNTPANVARAAFGGERGEIRVRRFACIPRRFAFVPGRFAFGPGRFAAGPQRFEVGTGRSVIYGHPAMLPSNPEDEQVDDELAAGFEEPDDEEDSSSDNSHDLINVDDTEEEVMGTESDINYDRPLYCRLLGPGSQNLTMSGPVIAEPSLRVSNRVVVMENGFGILPPAEDNLEFDQSGYLFGPNLAAISHVPSALYWWNEESKLLDGDSEADACIIQAHKLMPFLEMHREAELAERKRKRQEEEGFDYKNSVLKNSNEIMETEAEHKPAEAQTSARSDSSGNDSASDTAQLLAESIIDSVLRPTTSTSADNRGNNDYKNHKNKIVQHVLLIVLGANGQARRRAPGDMSLPRPSESMNLFIH